MATIIELNGTWLFKLDPRLEGGEAEIRCIFGTRNFREWVQKALPLLESDWKIDETPADQFDDQAVRFCRGDELVYPLQINVLKHAIDGIWELKTADLRIFGWFPGKDLFVAVVANLATFIKHHKLYNGYCGEVARFRSTIPLDDPKYVEGSDPNDVVSNYRYAW